MTERVYSRSSAVKLIGSIYGYSAERDNWILWYEEAWGHLMEAGLARVDTPLDLILVRMRIMALRWLVLDFCSVMDRDYWNSNPFWGDWASAAGVDANWSIWTLQADRQAAVIIKESNVCQPSFIETEDDEIVFDEDVCANLSLRLLILAVFRQREKVFEVLSNGFDCLYSSLVANLTDPLHLICERESALLDQLNFLEARLKSCDNESETARTSSLVANIQQQLDQDVLRKYAIDCLRASAAFESTPGFKWYENCCPVVNYGTPSVSLYES